jgi:serine/threonine-protein kinase
MAKESFVDEALLGRTIAGKFLIESYVGGGAMGAVYKAKQLALDKTVAIKVMHREMAKDEKFVHRFKREAKAASKLDHPNSLRVIDFGEEPDGLLYLAMEFLDGKDLFAVLKEGWPLADERIVAILIQALAALAVAHDQGIVHRDLKPENIMVLPGKDDEGNERDVVKVCDFGIAKITERVAVDKKATDSARLSTKGLVVGTPEYMSPEQGRGEPLDLRSDLYSMGVILFQLLTRQVPFDAESAIGIVLKHVTEEPARPSSIYPSVNPKLEVICLKALQKKKEDRYQNAREMRADLKAAIDGSLASIAIGARARMASASDSMRPMENAATIPIDLRSMTAAADMQPTSSKVTPIGTEALDELPDGVPRRWSGYVMALAIVGVVAFGAWELVRYYKRAAALAAANNGQPVATTPATTIAPPMPTRTITPDPPPNPSATTTASNVTPVVLAIPSGHVAPITSTVTRPAASASAAPSSSAATTTTASATVVPVVEAKPPASGPFVRIGTPKNLTGNVDARTLRNALAMSYAQLNNCYVNGIKNGDKAQAYTADMQVKLGTQSSATMGIPDFLAKSGQCVMSAATSALTSVAENGTADVPIEFVPGS